MADLVEPSEQCSKETVRVADLQKVALQRLLDEQLRRRPCLPVDPDRLDRIRVAVPATRGEKAPGAVREDRVEEEELAAPARLRERIEELLETLAPASLGVRGDNAERLSVERAEHAIPRLDILAEAAPPLADRR